MVLKYVTQLNSQDAGIVREALAKNKKLANLKDYDFLYKDFSDFLKKTGKELEDIVELPAFIELGEHVFPSHGLTNDGDILKYVIKEKDKILKDISIGFGSGISSEGLHLFLNDIKSGEDVFSTLEIFNNWMGTEGSIGCEVDGLLLDIGAFFNNKTFIYEKAHRFLVYNRKKYSKFLGQAFIDDLILLFSIPQEELQPPKIKIFKKTLKKTLLSLKRKQKNWEKIGYCDFYSYGDCKNNNKLKYSGVVLELWLDEKDRLILIVSPVENNEDNLVDSYYLKNLNRKIFDQFARNNISDWVNQYLATINFSEQLYKILRTKILLSNI